ncbi:hypothetical protein HXX01_05665, partial [Candidatus Nomurabacteria bacterium]|nr:hypothetical protein [Candidatus Nomurabacteria bacterium]
MRGSNVQIGTPRYNSYSLCLSSDRQIDYRLKVLISHETFHNWLGSKIKASNPEELLYWFTEGFSEFYARLILLRSNLITFDEYLDGYNKVLEEYSKSPYRFEKNEILVNNYWTDKDYNRLPFLRGDIIAHNLNSAIMNYSGGKKSLDDFMYEIFNRSKYESFVVSSGNIYNLIRFYSGEQTLSDITKSLNSGILLKPYQDALGPCFTVQTENTKKYWLFGEEFEIPKYVVRNEKELLNKDCFSVLG